MNISDFNSLIQERRSIFPPNYNEIPISEEIIHQILENANAAPNHKLTEPWRFKILRGVALQRLAAFLVEDYKTNTPVEQQSEVKLKKMAENPLRSDTAILICMQAHPQLLPEWEEIAAVAMAVQNMWLTCSAHKIGCYWSSPAAIQRMGNFIDLAENESCWGIFYMGHTDFEAPATKRTPIQDKCVWINE